MNMAPLPPIAVYAVAAKVNAWGIRLSPAVGSTVRYYRNTIGSGSWTDSEHDTPERMSGSYLGDGFVLLFLNVNPFKANEHPPLVRFRFGGATLDLPVLENY